MDYLGKHPTANYSHKCSDELFARYTTRQLIVMMAHLRRMLVNADQRREAFSKATPVTIERGDALLDAWTPLTQGVACVTPSPKQPRTLQAQDSWPDLDQLKIPMPEATATHT